MKNSEIPNPLIFNLGRIWQSASSGDWSEAVRLCDFAYEIGCKHSELKKIRNAALKQDIDLVDKNLNKILNW